MFDKIIGLPGDVFVGIALMIIAACLTLVNIRIIEKPNSLTTITLFALVGVTSIAVGLLAGAHVLIFVVLVSIAIVVAVVRQVIYSQGPQTTGWRW